MIHVTPVITAKPGKRDQVLSMLARPTCRRSTPRQAAWIPAQAIDAEGGTSAKYGPNTFVVIRTGRASTI